MHIHLETADSHAIQAYSDETIQINTMSYRISLIVSPKEIITDLSINTIEEMDIEYMELLLTLNPELIIIGHKNTGTFPPLIIVSELSKRRIGMECMSIGAACRTYNVLLSEKRAVVAGFIL